MAGVGCYSAIGLGDRPQTEIVGPASQDAIEPSHHFVFVQPRPPPFGLFAQLPAQPPKLLVRRSRPDIGPARARRVQPSDGVPQKVKRFVRPTTESCFRFVHRQTHPRHHAPHRGQPLFGVALTADHEGIGIVDDLSAETGLVSQRLPAQDEPTHIEVTQQRRERSPLRRPFTLVPFAWRSPFPSPFANLSHLPPPPPPDLPHP